MMFKVCVIFLFLCVSLRVLRQDIVLKKIGKE